MRRHLSLVLAVALLAGLLGAGSALAQTPRATPAQGTGTITLSESGWSDPAVGSWDAETRVATLTQDLTKSVLVQADNLTLDGAGHTMTGTGSGDGIYLDGRSGVTIRNLTVRRFARAFVLLASTEITVTASTASNSTYGYYLNNAASLCFLEGNTASDNDYGFYLRTVSEITLEENVASGNRFRGFHVERSSMNELSRNQALSNGQDGIYLQAAHYNTLDSNRSDGNGNYGLRVEACAANTLHANTMSQNRFNLRVDGTAENHYNHAIDESNLVDARAVIYRLDAP
ncbi:MAG: NosD domain-containing protein, partial [Anaerolineae bacterium]